MGWLRNLSIKGKLRLVTWLTSLAVLALVCGALAVYEWVTFRQTMGQDMTVLADALGRNSTAALSFQNEKDARETLAALAAEPHVLAACLFDKDQKRFATYVRQGVTAEFPDIPPAAEPRFANGRMELAHPVRFEGKPVGTLYLLADLQGMTTRFESYGIIVAAVTLVAFFVTLVLTSGLQRLISRPILALTDTARVVAERKDYSVRAPRSGRDEVGVLANAINQMLGEIENRQRALQQAKESLQTQSAQIAQTVEVLGSSATDILELSTHVAAAATETATAVTQSTATVEEVRHTALVSSQKTRHVSDDANRVAQISQTGRKSTEETREGMNRIRAQMLSIAESMARLSGQTQTIGDIIATVEGLAQQSNLLAVNAAIEAAKAGEQGKGFAVVAHEVKNLAEQSRQATTQVRTILSDIQQAASAAAQATEQGSKMVEAGVQQSAQAGESIVALASSIAEAADAAVQVASSSQQQLVGMDQVTQAMDRINQTSTQNVEIARQLESAARNLRNLGQQLTSLIAQYRKEEAIP